MKTQTLMTYVYHAAIRPIFEILSLDGLTPSSYIQKITCTKSWLHISHIPLKPLHTPLLRLMPINMRSRIAQLLKLRFRQPIMWRKNRLPLHAPQLRYPLSNILTRGIILLRLTHRIKYRITRLPSLRVITQIPINQCLREIPLPSPVINQQITIQVRRNIHAQPIMHIRLRIQLAHPRIYKRHPRLPLIPFLPPLLIIFPLHELEFQILRQIHTIMRNHNHHLPIAFPETDLPHPRCDAGAGA